MKSLNFSVPFCWPLVARGQKAQTIRMLYIPDYVVGEHIRLVARDRTVDPRNDVEILIGRVKEVFPIQLKNITLDIAKRDGFGTIDECQAKLCELNSVKRGHEGEHWGFVIRWEPVQMPTLELITSMDRMYEAAMARIHIQGTRPAKKQPVRLDAFLNANT